MQKKLLFRLAPLSLATLLLAACTTQPVRETESPALPAPQKSAQTKRSIAIIAPDDAPDIQPDIPSQEEVLTPSVWERFRQNTQLDLTLDNGIIRAERRFYETNPDYIERALARAEPFLYYIQAEIEKRGMPSEILLLPIVESAYDPFAYSHGRAAGLWQFIPGTARNFGLRQTWWYEGRRDVVASTEAALRYLQLLHKQFNGDWLLALAAYNAGEGTVARAVAANKRQGKPVDFWSLKLRNETSTYVPKLIAISQIFATPERYGITLREIPFEPYFATVDIKSQLDLTQAAAMAGISVEELSRLNPAFNHWATDPAGPHRLLVPIAQAEQFQLELDNIPASQRMQWDRYTIRSGDTVSIIARKFHITPELLKRVNGMTSHNLRAGATLLIPKSAHPSRQYASDTQRRQQVVPARPIAGKQKTLHTVGPGESLWSIARKYKVDMNELARWNGMTPKDSLVQGKRLVVWMADAVSTPATAREDSQRMRKIQYRARSGDSYAGIASKFNVSLNQIKRWNNVDLKKYLQPGDLLTLYVDVTQAPQRTR